MFKKYFITTFRHLWRYRLFTGLNILGLSISIATCWVIFSLVNYEFSYEKHVPQKEQVYRIISRMVFDEKESYNGGVSEPLLDAASKEISGLEYAVPMQNQWINSVEVIRNDGQKFSTDECEDAMAIGSAYFKMVPYRWLAGSEASALSAPENVVLTLSRAQFYFPGLTPEQMLHKRIVYYSDDTLQKTVTGIIEDIKGPSEFVGTEFFPRSNTKQYELNAWTNTNGSDKLYLKLKPGVSPENIIAQVNKMGNDHWNLFRKEKKPSWSMQREFEILPLAESHFATFLNSYDGDKTSKTILWGLVGIAVFLLVLACINFVNMSVASLPQRAKEIGVRKTLGSSKMNLIGRFLVETFCTVLLALFISFPLSNLGFWLLQDLLPKSITPFSNLGLMVLFSICILVIITLLAGLYPGWIITKVKTVNVFRSSRINIGEKKKFSLQKALIVFQFVIALVFITGAIIIGKQLQYTLKADMGFNKDGVILVDIPWKFYDDERYQDKHFPLLAELKRQSGIKAISLGRKPMSNNYSSSGYEYIQDGKEPVKHQMFLNFADTAFLNVYELKLLAGRNILPSDTINELVINETALKVFGLGTAADAIGKMIGQPSQKYPIVGVVADFHTQNFYKPIEPTAILSHNSNIRTYNIRLDHKNSRNWPAIIKNIEAKWSEFFPKESFSYKFYDEVLESMYEKERNMAVIINIATIIAIVISSLGLFGLVTLSAFQRTKEIGIRKVLGASVGGIIRLFSKEYLGLIALSFLIATPIAWWALNQWLEKFAYRIQMHWWLFVLGGIMALIIALITISFRAIKSAMANPVESLRTD